MNAIPGSSSRTVADAPAATRPDRSTWRLLYWSVRRELWENRSILVAPSIVAAVVLVGFVLGARRFADAFRAIDVLGRAQQAELLTKPLAITALPVIVTAMVVALFYCLDALHGERRDRSILFWKSLPVSDFVTVVAKALVPLAVVPAVACLAFMVLQVVILLVGSAYFVANGLDGTVLWASLPLFRVWGSLIYGVVGLALWYAPIYGWLLLVSGWARRSTFLFAVLPPAALCLIEKLAFDTSVTWSLLKDRITGFSSRAFVDAADGAGGPVPDPQALLGTPGLWIGLVVAALLVAATIRMRRDRQPL